MTKSIEAPKLSTDEILAFLKNTPPFNELNDAEMEKLAGQAKVIRYPAGHAILKRGKSAINHLVLIHTGKIKLSLINEEGQETVIAFREAGQTVGTLAILRESLSNLDAVAETDTICLLLARDDFSQLIQTNARFSHKYLMVLTEGFVDMVLTQLYRQKPPGAGAGSMLLFGAQVGDIVRRRPVSIRCEDSIQASAKMMAEEKIGSLLINDENDNPVGIVTDSDLRQVVARGMDLNTPVNQIMSSPLRAIPSHTLCFDALLEMIRSQHHHLVMKKNGRVEGMLSGHDLMLLQGSSPLRLVKEIGQANEIGQIYDLALRSPYVMHAMILEGAKPVNITRLITLVNDHILERILTLLEKQLGPPPVPYCWLLMGSEGRKEQTFSTDQDNGILYADPSGEIEAQACRDYFEKFSQEANQHLVNCGFPPCPGNIMASNPKWCQPLSVWKGYFEHWVTTNVPQDVLHATIFFDFRPGFGDWDLGYRLRSHLMEMVSGKDLFFRFLAKSCVSTPPAVGMFKRFVYEKEKGRKNTIDLKTKGLVPFVDFARLMSLRGGLEETNTLERLQAVLDAGQIAEEMFLKVSQAYEIQMGLRLIHQDQQWESGVDPDNFIRPARLGELARNNLKDALNTVNNIRAYLTEEFQLRSP